jgi:hypothetical protein
MIGAGSNAKGTLTATGSLQGRHRVDRASLTFSQSDSRLLCDLD